MKRNAILRICVYAGLILLLIGILCVGIFGMSPRLSIGHREDYVMATMAPMSEAAVPVTSPVEVREVLATGSTRAALNVYASPSVDAPVCGTMSKGTPVEVQIIQTVNGEEWAYVWGIAPGWVQMPLLEVDGEDQAPPETTITLLEEGEPGLRKFYEPITTLDISWPSGEVLIQPGDGEALEVRYGEAPVDFSITDKGRLKIHYESKKLFDFQKHALVVTLPAELSLNQVEIDVGSANVYIQDIGAEIKELELDSASGACTLKNLTIEDLEIDTASGPCALENLTVGQLDVNTASGKVAFTGSLNKLDFEGASAPLTAKIANHPKKINLETMSANLDIFLPEDCGHTIDFEAASGKLSTEFETKSAGSSRIYGDGACKIKIETMSGWVNIHKK